MAVFCSDVQAFRSAREGEQVWVVEQAGLQWYAIAATEEAARAAVSRYCGASCRPLTRQEWAASLVASLSDAEREALRRILA